MNGQAPRPVLRRVWFVLSDGRGIGVTAASELEARGLAEPVRTAYFAETSIVDAIWDVDLSTLDQNHVVPNLGPVVLRGVWYPRLNI